MSQLAVNSSGAKFSLLNEIELEAELNYEFSETDYTNMDMLEELDLAECILIATIQGRESLVRTLMDRVGPVRIVVKGNNKESKGYSLNGLALTFNIDEFASHATSPKSLKSLFKMIDEYGMKGLVEPGSTFPLLLQKVDFNRFLPKHNDSRFEGLLPELIDGVLRQPELAVALHDESSRVSTPGAYKAMLCWATEQMVQQFPQGLAPLRPFQEVIGHGSMKMWKAGSGQADNMSFDNIELGMGASEGCSQSISTLFHAMAPESARLGFRDEQGRVLCETTTDFLLAFPAQACTEDHLSATNDFVANYCPIEVMAVQAAEACHKDFGLMEKSYRFTEKMVERLFLNFDPLFSALAQENPLCERVKELMTKDQWQALLRRAESQSTAALVNLYQTLGIDNTGKKLKLNDADFEVLVQAGYQFAKDTQAYDHPTNFWAHGQKGQIGAKPWSPAVLLTLTGKADSPLVTDSLNNGQHLSILSSYQNVLKTNLWPAPGEAPTDIGSALRMASRLTLGGSNQPKSLALEAYLANAGLDACLAVAKTPGQWITLTQVFSVDELKPYLKTMPAKARGRVLESALGL